MFAIRLRVRPCRARCSPRSVGRSTVRVSLSTATFISRFTSWWSSPFGPFTLTAPGSTSTSTPSGISIGFRPILLIEVSSPDVCDDLSAHTALARLVAGHHAAGGGHDRGTHAAEHARDVLLGHVAAPAGSRDPLHPADHGTSVLRVAKPNLDHLADPGRLDAEVADVALLLEDAGHLALQPGCGDLDLLVLGQQSVANPVQVIGDWIGKHRLLATSSTWSFRARSRGGRHPAGRSGRGRTCGSTPAACRNG